MKGRRRLQRGLFLLALAAILTGCAYSCTSIGCTSGVTVYLPHARTMPRPATVRLCVDTECQTTTLKREQVAVTNETASLDPGQPVRVTFTTTSKGQTLIDATTMVEPQKTAPNGERCGPICTVASLRLEGTTLVSGGLTTP